MNRCEHNQRISKFCLSSLCNHREAGGCDFCFRKFHFHLGAANVATETDIEGVISQLVVPNQHKPKVKAIEETLHSYFSLLKSFVVSTLDELSKDLIDRVSHSYLFSLGMLPTLKKLRNKEYRRISSKQFREIVDFTRTTEDFAKKQMEQYQKEVAYTSLIVGAVNGAFGAFSKAVNKDDEKLNPSIKYFQRLNELIKNVQDEFKAKNSQTSPSNQKGRVNVFEQHRQKESEATPRREHQKGRLGTSIDKNSFSSKFKTQSGETNVTVTSAAPSRDIQNAPRQSANEKKIRKTSIDNSEFEDIPPKKEATYSEKEREIEEKKKKLYKILQKSNERQDSIREDEPKETNQDKLEIKKTQGRLTVPKVTQPATTSPSDSPACSQNLDHSKLPAAVEKPKLYEDRHQMVEKVMKVDVKQDSSGLGEILSPLIRRKLSQLPNTTVGGFSFDMKKAETTEAPQKQVVAEAFLSERQQNSLILMAESAKVEQSAAIPLLQAALKYAPHNVSAAEYLSYLYLLTGQPKDCLRVCLGVYEMVAHSHQALSFSKHILINQAAAMVMLGRYSEAISLLEKCVTVYRDNDIIHKNLGDAYYGVGIMEKALFHYKRCIEINPKNDEAHFNLAVCYYETKHFYECRLSLKDALRYDAKNTDYLKFHEVLKEMKVIYD